MHVALVGGLGVEGEGAEAALLRGLGGDGGHRDVAEAHAAPCFGHVRQPETPFLRGLPHRDDLADEDLAIPFVRLDLLLRRRDDLVAELAHAGDDEGHFLGKAEIDGHGGFSVARPETSPARARERARSRCPGHGSAGSREVAPRRARPQRLAVRAARLSRASQRVVSRRTSASACSSSARSATTAPPSP